MQNKDKWIIIFSPYIYPCKTGGIEVFHYYLANEIQNKLNVHIYTKCDVNYKNITTHLLKNVKYKKLFEPILILNFLFKNRKNIGIVYIAYARTSWTRWLTFFLANKLIGIKYAFTIHGGGAAKWKPKMPHKLFFKNAEFITAVSSELISEYEKRCNRKIIFTPPLVPFNILNKEKVCREEWGVTKDDKVLLYVGSLKPLKAVDSLIEAISLLPKEVIMESKLKVLIAGDGVDKKALRQKTKELNLSNIIIFLGNVERNNISKLYAIADYYTICSEFEGLPISLLEAYANSLPSIVSNAPGLLKIAKESQSSIIFETRNTADYSEKIKKLLYDLELQRKLKEKSFDYYSRNFSFSNLTNKFNKLFIKYV